MRHAMRLIAVVGMLVPAPATLAADDKEFTEDFRLEDCSFSSDGRNPYFSLEPGDQLVLEGEDQGETLLLQITVLRDRQWIAFETARGERILVRTRVVEEREWVDDELVEVSRNFFARCLETNDVFYFGEDVDIYENGVIVSHAGAWRAGRDGALPGLIMPGTFLLGARYFQEMAPDVALDRAEHAAMGLTVELPAGTFGDCVQILETSGLDPASKDTKTYCAGIGLVDDAGAQLVEFDVAGAEGGGEKASTDRSFPRRRR